MSLKYVTIHCIYLYTCFQTKCCTIALEIKDVLSLLYCNMHIPSFVHYIVHFNPYYFIQQFILRPSLSGHVCRMILSRTVTRTSNLLLRSMTSKVEQAKDAAAERAVRDHVYDGCRLGVGSGSTVVYAVKHLSVLVNKAGFKVTCVPTSFQVRPLSSYKFSDLNNNYQIKSYC